jgi:hypothetical protein
VDQQTDCLSKLLVIPFAVVPVCHWGQLRNHCFIQNMLQWELYGPVIERLTRCNEAFVESRGVVT